MPFPEFRLNLIKNVIAMHKVDISSRGCCKVVKRVALLEFSGCVHLCGYDPKGTMFEKQNMHHYTLVVFW